MSHKNLLLVIGHPSKKSLSHKLAKSYKEAAQAKGHTVETIDLYHVKKELPIVTYQNYPDWKQDSEIRKHYQDKIEHADTLVFFHPLWWGSWPALLKNFIDQTLTPGFAYKYTKKWWLPQALNVKPDGYLKGKRAHVFITYDAYTLIYAFLLFPFIKIWAIYVLFYCGIWRMKFTLHGRVRWASDAKREKWIDRARTLGEKA